MSHRNFKAVALLTCLMVVPCQGFSLGTAIDTLTDNRFSKVLVLACATLCVANLVHRQIQARQASGKPNASGGLAQRLVSLEDVVLTPDTGLQAQVARMQAKVATLGGAPTDE